MKNQFPPPLAPEKPHKMTHHGDTRIDPYFWLREKENPETLKYLKAENAYFSAQLKPFEKIKKKIYSEMFSRITQEDESVPAPNGPWLYFNQWKKGRQYKIHCRKAKGKTKVETLLDENLLAKGKKFCDVQSVETSPDHNILGYAADFDGSERYQISFLDLKTKKPLKDKLKNTSGNFLYSADSETLFYVKLNESLRPFQVWRHKLGSKVDADILVFEESDPKHFVSVAKSATGNFIFINSHGKITSEIWVLDAHNPSRKAQCFQPRIEGLEYEVDQAQDLFWVRTNLEAPNFKLMVTDLDQTSKDHWREYLPHSSDSYLNYCFHFKKFLVTHSLKKGLPQIEVFNLEKKSSQTLKFKDEAYHVGISPDNLEYSTDRLRLYYSSPITPNSILEYNMDKKVSKTLKIQKVKGHNPKKYICERTFVKSHDGTLVPLVLTYKKGLKKNKKNPAYLYGYGSYGAIIPDGFPGYRDPFRLIDRGFVYATAHIRGGGEMGRQWYEGGKFLNKKNTFLDFIACAEYLKTKGYCSPDQLVAMGGSAGGMLMGACINMRPDLFNLVVAHVPFVDVLNTMLDSSLPLTPMEYKEWGNPEADKQYYDYIKSYSPYDNIRPLNYPALFVTCGLNDPRVTYWEPAKWVARLRATKTDSHPIVFKTNMGAGHFGTSGRFEHLWEPAEEYAYILGFFGMDKK